MPEGLEQQDEAALIDRARGGETSAYSELVRRYQSLAHRTALAVAGPADADDVVQESFVKAHRALGRFRPGAPFRPWFLRIVTNEARNRRRSAGRRANLAIRSAAAEPDRAQPSAEDSALAGRRRAALRAAIDRMNERDRLVVTCRYLLELSEEETARVLRWPKGSVKSRLSRALDRLAAAMPAELLLPVGDSTEVTDG